MKNKKAIFLSLISLCLYIGYAFLIHHQVANIFAQDIPNRKVMACAITLSYVFGYCVFFLIIYACNLLLSKNKNFLLYFKQFLIYFIPLFILLLLTWPGIFKGDDFYVLKAIRTYTLSPAQTGITSLFYICCLRFFPSMASIPFFQITIICCIYAYIFKNLKDVYPNKKFIPCRIVCFLFPVLDGCLFTLRATLVGWIFLCVLCTCYFIWKKEQVSTSQLITTSLLTGLVIAWRSEFIYMLVFLPLYLLLLFKKSQAIKKVLLTATISFACILVSYSVCNIPNKVALNGSNKYPISLVINPLGNIFAQDEIRGKNAYDDIMTINELIDVQALRIHPSVRNISQYWNIPDTLPKDQLDAFMNASYDLILNNFDHFLYYRWLTFKYTNGMVADDINHPTAPTIDTIYTLNYYGENYREQYYFMNSVFGEKIRNTIIDLLACRHYGIENVKTNILYPIMYNCLPTFIIALLCMFISLLKKKYAMAGILFMSGLQLALIFITAPAMFFMYYFSFYLSGYFLSALCIDELKTDHIQ